MAERPFPKAVAWALFAACLLSGAALLLSESAARRAAGLGLLAAPLAVFLGLQLLYYALDRRHGGAR